jgi:amino acid adenylation domain-containing protein
MTGMIQEADLDQRVDQLVSAQAGRSPEAIAAVCGAHALSYRELERRSDRVANGLCSAGVVQGSLVGIYLDRSLDMLVALLAVMKSGGAYVPLDPDFPPERLSYMVEDAGISVLITQASLIASAPGQCRRIEIEQLLADESIDHLDAPALENAAGSSAIYVLYTSGSTGRPKGVVLEHRNIVNFLLSMQNEPGLGPHDRLLAVTTLSFDIAGLELYLPLITGAQVIIAERDDLGDGARLIALLDQHQATAMQATPSVWRVLIESGWRGTRDFKVLCGGEALPRELAAMLLSRCGQLWNMYGPTETAIWSSIHRVVDAGAAIPIGRPIMNTVVYVLDKSGRLAPTGIPGELHIGGAGVARGYLNRPELTAEKFVADPFSSVFGGRMYRTGDLGRYLRDGTLEYRSRIDHQIKMHGYRIELGEVEAALESHPSVKQAIANVMETKPGDTRLVAYILARVTAVDAGELRAHLEKRLPRYMIPQHFSTVEVFALTPNGKVDRAQLPAPQVQGHLVDHFVAPTTTAEKVVADVFRDVLGVDQVSADDSFFDLGGHSILATRVVAVLRKRGFQGITLRMLFEFPTVAVLAREIESLPRSETIAGDMEHEAFEF